MKKRYWLAILCAVLALVLTVAAASADEGDVYGRMTDAADLHDGDRIILVSDDGSYYQTMATDFSGIQVTITDNTITEQNGMLALTLAETDGGWLLATNDGYLAADGGALAIVSDQADATVWSISIASDGTATVSCADGSIVFAEQDGAYRFFCGDGGNEIAVYLIPYGNIFTITWKNYDGTILATGSVHGGKVPVYSGTTPEREPDADYRYEFSGWSPEPVAAVADAEYTAQYRQIQRQRCGDSLYWEYADGILTITGSGEMWDFYYQSYTSNSIPWFGYRKQITAIILPEGLKSIGNSAFEAITDSPGITEITIPSGVTRIGEYAFFNNKGLTEIVIPETVIHIGTQAFSWCEGLTAITIPDSVEYIGYAAFCGCTGLTELVIGRGVRELQGFGDCTGLTTVTIPDTVTSIGQGAFQNCTGLGEIFIPSSVTSIGGWAFSGCTGLMEVTIPEGVTSIGASAFSDCTGLRSVTMPCSADTSFSGCKSISSLHLTAGTGLWQIGVNPWYDSRNALRKVILDEGIQSIGENAFYDCTEISEIKIPDSVTSIGNCAFYGCTGLTDIYYSGTEAQRDEIVIEENNDPLLNARWHYNSTGPAPFTLVIDGGNVYDNIVISNGKALLAVPVKLKGTIEKPVFGMGFDLLYDPEQLYFSGATNFNIIVNGTNEGLLNCAYINYLGIVITEETEIMTLYFTLSKDIETGTEIAFMLKEGGYAETGSALTPTTWDIEADFLPYIVNEHEHVPGETVRELEVEPTCTAEGGYDEVVYCTVCGEELSREHIDTPALGHDLVHHDAKAATCTEIGWEEYDTCSRCDYTTYVELSNLGHDLVHHDAKEPTCTETGWEAYDTCSRCDYTTYTELPALGHDYGAPVYEWTEDNSIVTAKMICANDPEHIISEIVAPIYANITAATCEEPGVGMYVATFTTNALFTTQVKYIVLPALGHDLVHHDAQAATCTEIGWEAYDTCTRCDYTTYVEIPALGHDLMHHDAQAATCTEIGWEAYDTCSRCDYTTYVELPALGHDLHHHDAQAATCTEIGWEAYDTCSRCDYTTYVELPKLGHDLVHHDAQAATCTEIGWEAYDTCSRCDYTTYKEIPALGHDFVHHDARAATCTEIGWEAYDTCSRCDYTTYVELPALGHDLHHHDAQAATCTEIGWEAYDTCSRCDYTTYAEIPALGHAPGEPVRENEVAPTYTEEGHYDEVVYCTRCGAELERHTHTIERLPFEGTVEWNPEDVKFKGTTAYVIANGSAQTPRFTVKNSADGSVVDPAYYDYEYRENTNAGTGYVIVTFKGMYSGTAQGWFKIYLQPTTTTTVENVSNGIKLTWSAVPGAAGYVIYRRAWSSTTNDWTDFVRWYNVTGTEWIDGSDVDHKVYAGSRYQYGVKAYFARRVDPVSGALIGGNVGDNFNLGEVGPLKTTVRITTRTLNSVTTGTKQMTVKWSPSKNFTGYQIKYATDANFTKNVKAIKISDPKTAQAVIDGLKSGTTYYVTVRSYHEFNGMTYFGEWSNVKSCKVK